MECKSPECGECRINTVMDMVTVNISVTGGKIRQRCGTCFATTGMLQLSKYGNKIGGVQFQMNRERRVTGPQMDEQAGDV